MDGEYSVAVGRNCRESVANDRRITGADDTESSFVAAVEIEVDTDNDDVVIDVVVEAKAPL